MKELEVKGLLGSMFLPQFSKQVLEVIGASRFVSIMGGLFHRAERKADF